MLRKKFYNHQARLAVKINMIASILGHQQCAVKMSTEYVRTECKLIRDYKGTKPTRSYMF